MKNPIKSLEGQSFTAVDGTVLVSDDPYFTQIGTNVSAKGAYVGIGEIEFANMKIRLKGGGTHRTMSVERVALDLLYAALDVEEILWRGRRYDIQGAGSGGFTTSKWGWRMVVDLDGKWKRYDLEVGKRPGCSGDYYAELRMGVGLSVPLAFLR